jgi:hypothetical protein
MSVSSIIRDIDLGDLNRGDQLDLYNDLLNAIGGDLRPPSSRDGGTLRTEYRRGGVQDVAGWLCQQTRYSVADRLVVAQFWGGDQLRIDLQDRLSGLVAA